MTMTPLNDFLKPVPISRFNSALTTGFSAPTWIRPASYANALKNLGTMLCISLAITCGGLRLSVCSAEPNYPAPKAELVAPGIWRIRFGKLEELTPSHFQSFPMDKKKLNVLPAADSPSLEVDKIRFEVSSQGCVVRLPMEAGENIYGFGLSTALFDMTQTADGHTGRRVFLKPTDHPENELGESHAPVPFYCSSRGYGVFVDTARFASFCTGNVSPVQESAANGADASETNAANLYRARKQNAKTMLVEIPAAKGVDVYIFAGPAMLDAVKRYNLFSGGGCVPPLWGLGLQYRGLGSFGAEESLNLAARLRAEHMPCDVWGVEPGWQTKTYSCSFVWNTNRFTDPDDFIKKMHDLGFRLNFWEHAFTHPSSPIYRDLKPWSGNYMVWGGLVPDFATPSGKRIFLSQNQKVLFSKGVDAVKLDECDYQPESATPWSFPTASKFPSGLDGEQMHSLFGLLYQQTMLEPYAKKEIRTWGLVRNSHALAAPLPYGVYSDSYDHRCYVRGLVNEGFTGLLWVPEVRDAESIEDLYRRIETAVFSPDMVINCWYMKNPPWEQIDKDKSNRGESMPNREEVTAGVRKLLELRMSLVPYLYSAFNEYHQNGTPPIRALVLDWPGEPKLREIDDQYMFGSAIMVAPMFAGQKTRVVYLPKGEWYDFWTHVKYAGDQTISVTNNQEQIPLFVKSGTLLPLAKPVESIGTNTCFDITVYGFGAKPADFVLYEDDGVSTAFEAGRQDQLRLHGDQKSYTVKRTGSYDVQRYQIVDWRWIE
ncbi:MAG TPA: TIM-barrel domain-containing protein [Verrucomicrobiae bacterium]|nr:TIM-barrel domain-containing protein [Verrucomicrobiae bacterium]